MMTANARACWGQLTTKRERKPGGLTLPHLGGSIVIGFVKVDVLEVDVLRHLIDSLGDQDGSQGPRLHGSERQFASPRAWRHREIVERTSSTSCGRPELFECSSYASCARQAAALDTCSSSVDAATSVRLSAIFMRW